MFFGGLALACLFLTGICWTALHRLQLDGLVMAAAGGDEDMKIVSGGSFTRRTAEDAAEVAARQFLQQKESGNIEKARQLGKEFADAILNLENGPLKGEMEGKEFRQQHHQYLLYTYAVNRVIADHSPDSILAQTALNVYYSQVEAGSAELHRHISDMAAFSLYILCERSKKRSDEEIGTIFADLCGFAHNPDMVEYGNELFDRCYFFCVDKIRNIRYSDIEAS